MPVDHNGFTFVCDGYCGPDGVKKFIVRLTSRRTAIRHARAAGWFIGTVRVTSGMPKSKIRTVKRTFGPCCRWAVGAR